MSFLRKLFGEGKQPPKTPRGGPAAPGPSSSTAADDVPPAPPRAPTLADLEAAPRHSYFEYVGGGSSKFYAVSLEEDDGATWRVRFNFGRIGFPRSWDARVAGAPWDKAARTYMALVDEKLGKGYEIRPWPATLQLPDGTTFDEDAAASEAEREGVLFRASRRGSLPPARGGAIAGIPLPDGILYTPMPEGGSRGENPVIWASARPVANVGRVWSGLAAAFADTGMWPCVIDATYHFGRFDGYL